MLGLTKMSTLEAVQRALDLVLEALGVSSPEDAATKIEGLVESHQEGLKRAARAEHAQREAEVSAASSIASMKNRVGDIEHELAEERRARESDANGYTVVLSKATGELDDARDKLSAARSASYTMKTRHKAEIDRKEATASEQDDTIIGLNEALDAARSTILDCKNEALTWRNTADERQDALEASQEQCRLTEENVRRARQEAREEAARVALSHAEELVRAGKIPA